MIVNLVDGTFELHRQHFGQLLAPHQRKQNAVVIGVLSSTLQLIKNGTTNSGVATDHVIKSFRSDLWLGYKPSKGMEPQILRQILVLEDALTAT